MKEAISINARNKVKQYKAAEELHKLKSSKTSKKAKTSNFGTILGVIITVVVLCGCYCIWWKLKKNKD